MVSRNLPGQFEQMVLLAILRSEDEGYAISIRQQIEEATGRPVSRGALYRTLDRLEAKGYLSWEKEEAGDRGGYPRRRFQVTERAISVLRSSRDVMMHLWQGLDEVLGES